MFPLLEAFCKENNLSLSDTLMYNRYGDGSVSVTELLSVIVDPSFEFIKNNYASKLQDACDRGTRVHEAIENSDVKNITITPLWSEGNVDHKSTEESKYFLRWYDWKTSYAIEVLEKEKTVVWGNLRGNIDAITNIGIVDYKTSLRKNPKYHIQVAAYCYITGIEKGYILHLSKDKFIFVEVDVQKYIPIFLELFEYASGILAVNKQTLGQEI